MLEGYDGVILDRARIWPMRGLLGCGSSLSEGLIGLRCGAASLDDARQPFLLAAHVGGFYAASSSWDSPASIGLLIWSCDGDRRNSPPSIIAIPHPVSFVAA